MEAARDSCCAQVPRKGPNPSGDGRSSRYDILRVHEYERCYWTKGNKLSTRFTYHPNSSHPEILDPPRREITLEKPSSPRGEGLIFLHSGTYVEEPRTLRMVRPATS